MARKSTSRASRWADAVSQLRAGAEELRALVDEYQDWRDGMPDNLDQSPTAEKLDEVLNLDIDNLEGLIDEFDGADLPLGFGRD